MRAQVCLIGILLIMLRMLSPNSVLFPGVIVVHCINGLIPRTLDGARRAECMPAF